MKHNFVDEVTVTVRSGNGGAGCVSFRREKYVEFGGPDGGNGGCGGDVVVVADAQHSTLLDFRFRSRYIADNGGPGEGNQCSGADGQAIVLKVPVGTVVYDADSGNLLADLDVDAATYVLAKGGRGGKGNEHFKSSTRQAPRFAQPGEAGEEFLLRLELKLLADVGLIGMPSVGKSSLIARMSAARPKIADYPFTTLVPNLGVVQVSPGRSYVVADVPGLIAGAHEGAGLGARFLRHVDRVRCIVHLVTVAIEEPGRGPITDYEAIENELALHSGELMTLPRVLVLNRIDIPEVRASLPELEAYAESHGISCFGISAATGEGLKEFVDHLSKRILRG